MRDRVFDVPEPTSGRRAARHTGPRLAAHIRMACGSWRGAPDVMINELKSVVYGEMGDFPQSGIQPMEIPETEQNRCKKGRI